MLWLFGEKEYLTEAGTMNMFLVIKNKKGETELITPPLEFNRSIVLAINLTMPPYGCILFLVNSVGCPTDPALYRLGLFRLGLFRLGLFRLGLFRLGGVSRTIQ